VLAKSGISATNPIVIGGAIVRRPAACPPEFIGDGSNSSER
jgi:hypothetical protein